jgi:uncharacterized metal-binding protein
MPSGRTHLKIESALMVLWSGGAVWFMSRGWVSSSQVLLFVSAYLLSMLFLSPDLDLLDSSAYRRWRMLRWIWRPYAALFRHRRLSHHLIFGPLSRVLYLSALALSGLFVFLVVTDAPGPRLRISALLILPICLGVYLPNVEHIVADHVTTFWRRRRRSRRL